VKQTERGGRVMDDKKGESTEEIELPQEEDTA